MPRERLALALLSLSAVVFEIALTRLASVLLHAVLAPVVIATCLAALGLGAAFAARTRVAPATAAVLVALGGVAALAAVVTSPFGFALGLFTLPFFGFGLFAGAVYGSHGAPRLTYAFDVLGGAAGAAMAPLLLQRLGETNTALAATAIAALAGLLVGGRLVLLLAPPALLALNLSLGVLSVDPYADFGFPAHLVLQTKAKAGRVIQTAWDGFARTDLVVTNEPSLRYLFTDRMYTARIARWDGRSARFADEGLERLVALKRLPFNALGPRQVLVLGSGGGLDVALALQAGAAHVDAVEINAAMIRITRAQADFSGRVYDRPDVTVHHDEARRYVRASDTHYDLISLSLLQTEPALDRTMTGFQSFVFTAESVGEYLERLAPGGVIAIVQNTDALTRKTVATAVASFEERGLGRSAAEADMVVLALEPGGGNPFAHLVLIGNDPLPAPTLDALGAQATAIGARLESPPSLPESLAPATDERPFFYEAEGARPILFALTAGGASALLLLAFLRDRMAPGAERLAVRGWIQASALGAGFMLLEAGLLTRGQFLVGYPAIAVALVTGGMLAAAGLGAALSAGSARPPSARLALGTTLVAVAAILEATLWPFFKEATGGLAAPQAGALLLAFVAMVGAPAGLCLPALLELGRESAATIYAANALATVVGGSAATLLARAWGLASAFVAAGALYAVCGALLLWRPAAERLREVAPGLARHVPADSSEGRDLTRILAFIRAHAQPFDRRIAEGHLTSSALVIAEAGDRVLLLHHKKLDRWLQPGGHADPGEQSGEAVALREAREETGIEGLALHPEAPRPLDVDVHAIPAHGNDPAHEHLDLRYLVVAPEAALARLKADESHAIRWFKWEDLASLDLDPGLVRALRKARSFWR